MYMGHIINSSMHYGTNFVMSIRNLSSKAILGKAFFLRVDALVGEQYQSMKPAVLLALPQRKEEFYRRGLGES